MKRLKSIPWRVLVGMLVYAVYLVLGYFGERMEYYTAFILQCVITTAAIGFAIYLWRQFARKNSRQVDGAFYFPSIIELLSALRFAHEKMDLTGWTLKDYSTRWKDCDDFAERQSTLMKEWFYTHKPASKSVGLPIAPFGYNKDSGEGHVCVECFCEDADTRIFFEVYPGYGEPLNLSKKEIKSAQWKNF